MHAFDCVIKNATIIDGSGEAPFSADIGIAGSMILSIGKIDISGKENIDGEGLIACPGFIDSHTHIDLAFVNHTRAENYLMQGVTTAVGGHCGISMAPVLDAEFCNSYINNIINSKFERSWVSFGEWLDFVERRGLGINYVPLVGLNLLRGGILGKNCHRPASGDEITRISMELEKALDAGAFGMSASFDAATPGYYADKAEMLALLGMLRDRRSVFAPHTRHHQNQRASDSYDETAYGLFSGPMGEAITGRYHGFLEVLEYADLIQGLNMMISHLTPSYVVPQPHPAYLDRVLARATLDEIITQPRKRGLNISFNMVAADYSIGSEQYLADSLLNKASAIPDNIKNLSREQLSRECNFESFRKQVMDLVNNGRLKFGMLSAATDSYWSQCFRFTSNVSATYMGKTVFEIAKGRSSKGIAEILYREATEVVCDVLQENPDAKWSMIWDKREAGTYQDILRHPFGMPCCDSASYGAAPDREICYLGYGISPLAYNLMPSFLIEMVKKRKYLKLEEAVRKMTSLPAEILGIEKRGRIEKGYFADITLIDWEKLKVHHDFCVPEKAPEGIEYTIVNGATAYRRKTITGVNHGRVLRKLKG